MYYKKETAKIPCKIYLLLQASFKIKLFTLMQHFSLYRKSLHEEDIEKRRISKLQRREHQKVKRKMGIGKQIEKVSIIKLLVPLQLKEWQDYWAVCKAEWLNIWSRSRILFIQ